MKFWNGGLENVLLLHFTYANMSDLIARTIVSIAAFYQDPNYF